MDCDDLLKELGDYLEEDLTAEMRRELEEHLADCRPCEIVADTARMTVKIVTGCGSFDLPPRLSAKVMTRIRAVAVVSSAPASPARNAKSRPSSGPAPKPRRRR